MARIIMTTDGMIVPGIFKKMGEEVSVSDELAIVLENKGMAKAVEEAKAVEVEVKVEAISTADTKKTATKK